MKKKDYNISHLDKLESESMHIIREAVAEFSNPVMLYSIGKDSSVMLHIARKAFYPGNIPFPLLHIDTGFKFSEMIKFRDYYVKKIGADLIVYQNNEPEALDLRAKDCHTEEYIYLKKTKPLLEAMKEYAFDAAFGGARRDEEKSRAKERIFSIRSEQGSWDPKNQRPELWNLYNARLKKGQSMRVFPLSNWTELDVWMYIKREKIEVVPLYFSKKRKLVRRNGALIRIDKFTKPVKGEDVIEEFCRYRTLGCAPSTGAVISKACNLDEIISEVLEARKSERETRVIDYSGASSMEKKKKDGYF